MTTSNTVLERPAPAAAGVDRPDFSVLLERARKLRPILKQRAQQTAMRPNSYCNATCAWPAKWLNKA